MSIPHATIVRRFALVSLLTLLTLSSLAQFNPFGGGGPPAGGRRGGGGPGGRGGRGGGGTDMGGGIVVSSRDLGFSEETDELMQQVAKGINPEFANDVFTFTRLMYGTNGGRGRQWDDDANDAELNLIFRLYQITSLKVHPTYNYIRITPKALAEQPFSYLSASGSVVFTDDEAKALRNYLMNGGFMMAEDFWGDSALAHFQNQMSRVFPGRPMVELPLSHPIFHTVFDFKHLPQTPSAGRGDGATMNSWDNADYNYETHEPRYFGIFDDKQRMMVLVCHNNHFGDGWEHEGDDHGYFDRFSAAQAYPMFINILFYAMTH